MNRTARTQVNATVAGTETHLWGSNPVEAHKLWRRSLTVSSGRPYAEHSNNVYHCFFARFVRWLNGRGINLVGASSADLAAFLDSLSGRSSLAASNRTQRSYLAEINRVMAHLRDIGVRKDNPASDLLGQLKVTTPMKARSIMYMSDSVRLEYLKHLDKLSPSGLESAEIQSHAMACLILEMGFTVKEIQKLVLRDVVFVEVNFSERCRVTAAGHRTLQPRTDVLSEIGSRWIAAWLMVRGSLSIVTPQGYARLKGRGAAENLKQEASSIEIPPHLARVFVTLAGKSNRSSSGLRQCNLAINRLREDAVHAAARKVFSISGEIERGKFMSPQTLRNACGAALLNSGYSDREVANKLGLMTLDQIWALKRTAMVGQISIS